ncbi:MAG: hypothetical protein H7A48_10525 [Akkermansiaceae bacterium]|nr:hypothetical protein [Akkermansiaceae bacterium]MCP5548916.1 hypothetical protein [Akkermansiaceae bacterium]
MNTPRQRKGKPGYVSYVLVLSTGAILGLMMLFAYRSASRSAQVQSAVQLRVDYAEKENAVLRSIVALTPNRAIRAMKNGSNSTSSVRNPLRWRNIFEESLDMANARTSIATDLLDSIGVENASVGNSGDSTLTSESRIFRSLPGESGWVSPGINRSLGTGYPVPLSTSNATVISNDNVYPIIAKDKVYGNLASSGVGLPVDTYPDFNILTYPEINFGYARPGDPFVAKRNWWAFTMDIADHDDNLTFLSTPKRYFVLSIYEIPSQLAISASAFMSLGAYASGEEWQDDKVNIEGNVFAGKARVEADTALDSLASRRGMTMGNNATIGGQSFNASPFAPGVREAYQVTQGDFFPVSLASESGRVAFVPINRGVAFFDRFHTENGNESNTLSPTTWNDYSVGALQCAMRLDITECKSSTDPTPTKLRFSYLKGGVRTNLDIQLETSQYSGLPPGYILACGENQSYDFGDTVVDVAYGHNGSFAFQTGVTGVVTFNNARFGDPLYGTYKYGYYKPSYPFEVKLLPSGQTCIAVYPQRLPDFLRALNADSTAVNSSIAVNVDYTTTTGSVNLRQPLIPCTDLDYGVILQECSDLTGFTKGFSMVTNLRMFIGDDFNVVPATPPSGYIPSGTYYPPCSLFTPEKRYGVEIDPFAISLEGQIGSLASDTAANPVHPLDAKTMTGGSLGADRITVNLKPITHPAELPPITMMNWLVVLEEVRDDLKTP